MWFIVDILILLIVGVVCIRQVVTVGDNVPLTSGKKTKSIDDFGVVMRGETFRFAYDIFKVVQVSVAVT